ncbi:MAG: hypothetical protein ACFFBI_00680 [Promethearchaeota archaeon]
MVKIRICPKCKKPTLKMAMNVSGWLAPDLFECRDKKCGYVGQFYIEIDSEDFELEQEDNEENSLEE